MESVSNVKINLQRPNSVPVIYAKQDDKCTRTIVATLYDGDVPWIPPNNVHALVRCAKPDRTYVVYDSIENSADAVSITSGSPIITIRLRQQALAAAGDVFVEVNFYLGTNNNKTEKLTTFAIIVRVEKSVIDDSIIESSDEFDLLSQDIAAVLAVNTAANQADAVASVGSTANVSVTKNTRGGFHFDFTIPRGPTGDAAYVSSRLLRYAQLDDFVQPANVSDSSWSADVPTPRALKYIYTRIDDTYNNGSVKTSYMVSRNGKNGAGAIESINGYDDDNVVLTAADVGTMTTSEINTAIQTAVQNALTSYLADYVQIGYVYYKVNQHATGATPNVNSVTISLTIPEHLQGTHQIGGVLGFRLDTSVPAAVITDIVTTGNNPHVTVYAAGVLSSASLPFDYYGTGIYVYVLYIRNTFTSS